MPNLPTKNKAKVCYYCGAPLERGKRTIDHMTPLARGGENRQYNRVWCCRRCNSLKMDMTVAEFLLYKELRKKYKGEELIEKCRENNILLTPEERLIRNTLEKKHRRENKKRKK